MRRVISGSIVFMLCPAFGQVPAHFTCEVASVKAVAPGTPSRRPAGGPGTDDPIRFTCATTMATILQTAFGVKPNQLDGLPDWTRRDRFEIIANVPPGATTEQFQEMLQDLLNVRFGLAFHRMKKEIDGFSLTVAKGGPKLKATAPPGGPPPADLGTRPETVLDQDGFPKLPAGYKASATSGSTVSTGAIRMTFRKSSPADLAMALGRGAIPISDQTGLTGPFDFTLEYDPESLIALLPSVPFPPAEPPAGSNAPDIFVALEKQLGLKLQKARLQIDGLAIDHLDSVPKPD